MQLKEKPLFNGTDLDGWHGDTRAWQWQAGGELVGTAPQGTLKHSIFLWSDKSYKNFELSFQAHLKDDNGWTGVQIRSKKTTLGKLAPISGPQVDYWGSLTSENFLGTMKQAPIEEVKKVLKAGFNDYYVRCVGKRVAIRVNGLTTVDEEFAKLPEEGIIAFQVHGSRQGPAEVVYRNVRIRELPAQD